MSQTPGGPAGAPLNLRGAVDLSGLGRPPAATAATAGGGYVVELTERSFQAVVQQSTQVPVLVAFVSASSPASTELVADLRAVVDGLAGRALLAVADFDAQQQVAAAFQVQSVPTVMAVLAGQPVPLFAGPANREQIQQVVDQVMQAAAQNGISGTVPAAPSDDPAPAPDEPQTPPNLVPAENALVAGDLPGAIAAYEKALADNPGDTEAKDGLVRARFLQRVATHDPAAVRQAAADDPKDVAAQLAAADLELYGGNVADAFNRLIDTVRITTGDDRESARARLVELFEVVGSDDPDLVAKARRRLSTALF